MSKGSVPLAIVPSNPYHHRRRSSILSGPASPRTPRNCVSPTGSSVNLSFSKRRSTDSWNSSIHDVGDEIDVDWAPEHTLFLQRTLDSLPVHLLTPFNAGVPPSNLLDKIARKVADAKDPSWPHSLRATRIKLLEMSRQRAREDPIVISDEADDNDQLPDSETLALTGKTPRGLKRPIYRQSSMDFLNTARDDNSISRLSARLQRNDQVIHPRPRRSPRLNAQANGRDRRSSSPPLPVNVPSLTPSSSTLNSYSSFSTTASVRPHGLRRSASTVSSISTDSLMSCSGNGSADNESVHRLAPSAMPAIPDRRLQRVRRSESFCVTSSSKGGMSFAMPPVSETPAQPRQSFKRAPSFGALAQEAKARGTSFMSGYGAPSAASSKYSLDPSSDEEERARSRGAKKAKRGSGAVTPQLDQSYTPEDSGMKLRSRRSLGLEKKRSSTSSASLSSVIDENSPGPNVKRRSGSQKPSMYGSSLPHLHIPSTSSSRATSISSPDRLNRPLPELPTEDPPRTLRRVKRFVGSRPSRRISFNSLTPPASGEEADTEPESTGLAEQEELGSAFQLH